MTLILEAVEAFIYRWPGGEVELRPGWPVEFQTDRAQRIVEKAHGLVRVVSRDHGLKLGAMISWHSPRYGKCSGRVAMLPQCSDEYILIGDHTVTKSLAFVSKNLDVRVIDEPATFSSTNPPPTGEKE